MTQIPTYQIVLYQLIPIGMLLLPLLEAVGLTIFWRHSLSRPWAYGVLAVFIAYAVAAGVIFAAEKYCSRKGGTVSAYFLEETVDSKPVLVQTGDDPTFSPLTAAWIGLLVVVVIASAVALWGLKYLFKPAGP
jgi:hypothetical protein